IEVSQIIIHKADQPNIVVYFFDADGLAGEDRAEIDLFAAQTQAAAMGHVKCPAEIYQPASRAYQGLPDVDSNGRTKL
ncbi:MAG: hypothetical protein ACRD3B_03635, partial [Candidatus Sulfotelmatobacter sp.]